MTQFRGHIETGLAMDQAVESGTMDAGCLFWIARIVWHQIAGEPLGTVDDFVHRSFVDAAAEEAK